MRRKIVLILLCILMTFVVGITTVSAEGNELEIGEPAPAFDCEEITCYGSGEEQNKQDMSNAPEGEKGVGITYRTMDEIEAYFDGHPASIDTELAYASGSAPVLSGQLSAGKLSKETLDSALNTMNRVRFIAGLNEVKLDSNYNGYAQSAALISYLNGSISHDPKRPAEMTGLDDMYEAAKYGCSHSNLAYRYDSSKKNYSIDRMIISGWMPDTSGSSIQALGHRRWIIYPGMKSTGFGAVKKDGYTYAANYVVDVHDGSDDTRAGVPWPARNMPTAYFAGNDPWSFSVGQTLTESTVSVTLKRRSDNKTWKFFTGTKDGIFYVDNGGYGLKGCIIFRPDGISSYSDGDVYDVNITYGDNKEIAYSVNFFELYGDRSTSPQKVSDVKISLIDDGKAVDNGEASLDCIINISTDTAYSKIYYTLDGSDPVAPADLGLAPAPTRIYSDLIRINSGDINTSTAVKGKTLGTVTVKAVAARTGFESSSIIAKTFVIKDDSENWGDITEEDQKLFSAPSDVKNQLWISGVSNEEYCGKAITFPQMRVYMHKTLLSVNKDYTVKYKNNTKAGKASIVITGKGNYASTREENFTISPLDLSKAEVLDMAFAYKEGTVQKGVPTVRYRIKGSDVSLKLNKDFVLEYGSAFDYMSQGNYPVKIKAVEPGNYTGEISVMEHITDKNLISKAKVTVQNMPYNNGEEIKPEPVVTFNGVDPLIKETDYEVKYIYNREVGTAVAVIVGKGDYVGTKRVTFKVTGLSVNKLGYDYKTAFTYTGTKIEPELSVYELTPDGLPSEKKLVKEKDYTVRYLNNINAGTKAMIEITGLGGYYGTAKKTFKIDPLELTDDNFLASFTAIYMKGGAKPDAKVHVTLNGADRVLKEGTDYTVSYGNNKSVIANAEARPFVKIKGKGNFKGTVEKNFEIQKANIADMDVVVSDITYKKTSGICNPSLKIVDKDGKNLSAGKDYVQKIQYTYVVTTSNVMIAGDDGKPIYDVHGKEVTETRRAGRRVEAKDIVPAGTEIMATISTPANGNYSGTTSKVFRFTEANVSKATIKLKNSKYYTGKAIYPSKDDLEIKVNDIVLSADDYDIINYSNNIKKGTGKITIQGRGNYGGRKTLSFSILARLIDLFLA